MVTGEATVFASISKPPGAVMTDREPRDRVLGIPIWKRKRDGIWWADFRRYEGGGRESLGTRDRTEAEENLSDRKRELERYEEQMVAREQGDPLLEDFAQKHLDLKQGQVSESTLDNDERSLGYLATFLKRRLPRKPRLSDVTAPRLSEFLQWRLESVKASTAGVELSCISSMLSRAEDWRLVDRNEAKHVTRPKTESTEAVWLETGEAAKVLDAAKAMEGDPSSRCYRHLHALIGTFLLTGGRRQEVFGLLRRDIDLKAGTVRFAPNAHRDLKTDHSKRTVPLWPQLGEILTPRIEDVDDEPEALLFPARGGGMLTTLRWSLSTLEDRAELEKHLTLKVFRHTYTATRIQTLDGGEPVSLYTVSRELGHKGVSRIEDTYGHLQRRRSRLAQVLYREADVIDLEERRGA